MTSTESRLLAHWNDTARTGRRARGRAWYPAARAWAETLAHETGHTLEQVVAVLAITSPGAQLRTNLAWTESILRGECETAGRFPNANRPKIANVLSDPANAAEYVTGPKVGPFHHAILGDTSALVLDRWAIFAATGERGDQAVGKVADTKRRDAVDTAYRNIARRVGLSVRDFQAAIWIHVRETTPKITPRGPVFVRYADITA
jgi:hypothetical protein